VVGLLRPGIAIRGASRLALVSIAVGALRAILILVSTGLGGTVLISIPRSLLLFVARRALGLVLVPVTSDALRTLLVLVATATLRPILVAFAALRLGASRARGSLTGLSSLRHASLGTAALARHAALARRLAVFLGAARSTTTLTSVHFFSRRASTHAAHAATHATLVGRLGQRQGPGAKKRGQRNR